MNDVTRQFMYAMDTIGERCVPIRYEITKYLNILIKYIYIFFSNIMLLAFQIDLLQTLHILHGENYVVK